MKEAQFSVLAIASHMANSVSIEEQQIEHVSSEAPVQSQGHTLICCHVTKCWDNTCIEKRREMT